MEDRRLGAIYIRVSTEMQEDGVSLEAQEASCRAELARLEIGLGRIYRDVQSAKDDTRPQYRELVADLRAGAWAAVVAWDWDRLIRNVGNGAELLAAFQAGRCLPVSVLSPIDLSSPAGRAMYHVRNTFAAFEREMISERCRAAWHHKVLSGEYHGGRIPYGYRLDNGRLVPNPETADTLRWIYQSYADGGSSTQIVRDLNAAGTPTSRGFARAWTPTAVLAVLRQPVQRGVRKFGPVTGPSPVERLVDPEIVARVDALLASRAFRRGPTSISNPWARVIKCQCGHSVTVSGSGAGKVYKYLLCQSRAQGQRCGTLTIRLDRAVAFATAVVHAARGAEPVPIAVAPDVSDQLRELAAVEADAADAYLRLRSITREYYEGIVKDCEAKRASLQQGAGREPADKRLLELWEIQTVAEQVITLRMLLHSATMTDLGLEVVYGRTGWRGMPRGALLRRDGKVKIFR